VRSPIPSRQATNPGCLTNFLLGAATRPPATSTVAARTGYVESSVRDVDEMRSSLPGRVDDVVAERRRVHRERDRVAARSDDRQLELGLARLVTDY